MDKRSNVTVEPRKARLSMFTSGAENPHFVERVSVDLLCNLQLQVFYLIRLLKENALP